MSRGSFHDLVSGSDVVRLFAVCVPLLFACASVLPTIPAEDCDTNCGTEETIELALKACSELEDESARDYCTLGMKAASSQCRARCR